MKYEELLLLAKRLSIADQPYLVSDLPGNTKEDYLFVRRNELTNKQGCCPYCNSKNYIRFGKDKGCRCFRCKDCFQMKRYKYIEVSHQWFFTTQYLITAVNVNDILHMKFFIKYS